MKTLKKNVHLIQMADNPPVNTYLRYSIPMAIAMLGKGTKEWLQSSLIQLKCKVDHSQILILLNKIPNLKIGLTLFNKIGGKAPQSIINNIINKISNDYCVSVFLDQFYIPNTSSYRKNHYIHREFIIGYNIKEEKIYLKTYGKSGYIVDSEMCFTDFINAFCWSKNICRKNSLFAVAYCYKRKEWVKPRFNYKCFYHSLNCYTKSKMSLLCRFYTQGLMIVDRENTYKCVYGIKVHEHLAGLIYSSYISKELNRIPLIKLDMVYSHKKCMVNRLVFLRDEYINKLDDINKIDIIKNQLNEAIIVYETIEKNYSIYKRLYIKAQVNGKSEELLKIIEGIKSMMDLEKNALEKLLPYLTWLLKK